MERCWQGKFSGLSQCPAEGRYGNPDYRGRADRPGLDTFVSFMRAARWCAEHRHPGDRLLEPVVNGTSCESRDGAGDCTSAP
jgi:hypothetical protein